MVMKIFRKKREQDGFTLLELLVALSILAVGLLAAASMQGVAINKDSIANNISVSSMLTTQVAEDILSSDPFDPNNKYNLYCQPTTTACQGSTTNAYPYSFYDVTSNTTSTSISVPGSGTYSATYAIKTNATVSGTSQVQVVVSRSSNTSSNYGSYQTTYTTYKRVQ